MEMLIPLLTTPKHFNIFHCSMLSHIVNEHFNFSQRCVCTEWHAGMLCAIVLCKEKGPGAVLYLQIQAKQHKLRRKWKSLKCEWVSLGIIVLSATKLQ